jgi:hypothetical protein
MITTLVSAVHAEMCVGDESKVILGYPCSWLFVLPFLSLSSDKEEYRVLFNENYPPLYLKYPYCTAHFV